MLDCGNQVFQGPRHRSAQSLKRRRPAGVVINNFYRVSRAVVAATVAIAGEDGKAGILKESGIDLREIAEDEDGAACGFEPAGVEAIGAQPSGNALIRRNFFLTHEFQLIARARAHGCARLADANLARTPNNCHTN